MENDITELMEKDGPQSNSYQLFNNLKKTLAETRAKVQVLQWNPIMVGGGELVDFSETLKRLEMKNESGCRLKPKIETYKFCLMLLSREIYTLLKLQLNFYMPYLVQNF